LLAQQAHYVCLAGVIQSLVQSQFNVEHAKQWMVENGYASELTLIEGYSIPNDDQFLLPEFEGLILLLARSVDEWSLGKQGWSPEEMLKLQAFIKEG